MDAFFASIEQRDNPDWKNKPLAVGSPSARGVVAAASYEARKYGIYSAQSSQKALMLCPDIIFAPPRFDVYQQVSDQLHEIFLEYTPIIEPLSLDEAFLDVTEHHQNAEKIAKEIKKYILQRTDLTASAGISHNKFLAKLASDMQKPNGLVVINQSDLPDILDTLPVERFYGIGKATATKMHKHNIHTGKDIRTTDPLMLKRLFGKQGEFLYYIAQGIDDREVEAEHIRKSLGVERTYDNDLKTNFQRIVELYELEKELFKRIKDNNFYGHTLSLKIKFHDFKVYSKSRTIDQKFDNFNLIHKYSKELLLQMELDRSSIRLMGLTVSNTNDRDILASTHQQLTIPF